MNLVGIVISLIVVDVDAPIKVQAPINQQINYFDKKNLPAYSTKYSSGFNKNATLPALKSIVLVCWQTTVVPSPVPNSFGTE
jgi:hypothetical protein